MLDLNRREDEAADRQLSLGEMLKALVKGGYIDQGMADGLTQSRQGSAGLELHPLVIIADQNWPDARHKGKTLDLETLTALLASGMKLPYLRIDPLKIDVASITQVMSFAYATRFKILPVEVSQNEVVVATSEPFVREWEKAIKHVSGAKISRVIANPIEISRYLTEFYNLSSSMKGAVSSNKSSRALEAGITNLEQLVELGRSGKLDSNDQHIVNIVDWLLQYAFEQRASDIHIEPRRQVGNVRFRIDGVLHTVYEMPTPIVAAVTSRIKAIGRMDVVERRRPQDGRVKTKTPSGNEVELRLSTMPTAFGEKLVMRIFNPDVLVKSFEALGFAADDAGRWDDMVKHDHGIILVTGPTGSGKTTTLYSTLKNLAQPEVNVCTIEDPIEMVEPAFNQMQVQHNINLDFASGVRTLLRQDPDIIMVGEIRDLETAEMAVQAALTGHLVLSTLHTNDAPSAITRLLELGIPSYLIKATVLGVVAQRLVRTLCPHCKKSAKLDKDIWKAFAKGFGIDPPESICEPVGCLECRETGYLGRVGIYEILNISRETRKLIKAETDSFEIRGQAVKDGIMPLHIAGLAKVGAGFTTLDEIMKVAPPPDE